MAYVVADEVRVVDEALRDVPADGADHGRGRDARQQLMKGYYRDPEATARGLSRRLVPLRRSGP